MRQIKALACTCGDCLHWEILEVETSGKTVLKCKTCEHVFPINNIDIPTHDKLVWVAKKEAIG